MSHYFSKNLKTSLKNCKDIFLISMKSNISLLVLVMMFCWSGCTEHETRDKEGLLLAIEAFNKAFQESDLVTLDAMTTENYRHTNGNSKSFGKEDWFSYLEKRDARIQSGSLEVMGYQMDEMEVELYGNTAIVTGRIIVVQAEHGETQTNAYRITNIWINDDGNWKRAGFHDGKIE
jgi:ketosteroid isomerase-like protein